MSASIYENANEHRMPAPASGVETSTVRVLAQIIRRVGPTDASGVTTLDVTPDECDLSSDPVVAIHHLFGDPPDATRHTVRFEVYPDQGAFEDAHRERREWIDEMIASGREPWIVFEHWKEQRAGDAVAHTA